MTGQKRARNRVMRVIDPTRRSDASHGELHYAEGILLRANQEGCIGSSRLTICYRQPPVLFFERSAWSCTWMGICILPLTSNSYASPEPCGSFICASGSPGDSCSTTSVVSLGGDALILMYSGWLQISDGGFLEIPWCAGNDLSYKSKAWLCRSLVKQRRSSKQKAF